MTPQHPAAPETETDANGLTEAIAKTVVEELGLIWPDECESMHVEVARAVERIVAERVRVVEGERDAAVGALDVAPEILRLAEMSNQVGYWKTRAESAEAAHERLRAELQADLDLLAFVGCQFFACEGPDHEPEDMVTCRVCWRMHELRALLTGGGAR